MTHLLKSLLLGASIALTTGCTAGSSESFTFTADLPPNFAYYAIAKYAPAEGETCSVTLDDNPYLGFNREWRTEYKPESQIPIHRTVKGCRLAIHRIDLEINAIYGKSRGDFSGDSAIIFIKKQLKEQQKGTSYTAIEYPISGQCEWLFRTQGPKRRLSKSIKCTGIGIQGTPSKGRPFGVYTLDQLPGKIVKLKIKLADEERPGWGDTWVKVPNGWKRCLGKGMEDQDAYCFGTYTEFSTFVMPDGRSCTIYPDCTE